MPALLGALLAVLALGAALPATAAAAKKKKKPARYSWVMQLETNKYLHSNCTAWGVNRRVTNNDWKYEREVGKGGLGGSVVETSGRWREVNSRIDTHPDGNQIPDESDKKGEIEKEVNRSGSVRIRKGEVVLVPLIGPAFPSVRVPIPKLKKGKSATVPISESQFEQQDPLDEGCTAYHARTTVTGSVTIKRLR